MLDAMIDRLNKHIQKPRDDSGPVAAIVCGDGFEVSVQAGRFIYCTPRQHQGPWTHVECGFPSAVVLEWMEYAEDPGRPTETVYAQVPIDVVARTLLDHDWCGLTKHYWPTV